MTYAKIGIDTCRRLGFVSEEWFLMQHVAGNDLRLGRWDELLEMTRTLPDPKDEPAVEIAAHAFAMCSAIVYLERGESVEALAVMDRWVDPNELDGTGDAQLRLVNESLKAIRARAQGNDEERLRAGRSAFQAYHDEGISHGWVKWAFEETIAGALALGDVRVAEAQVLEVASMPPGRLPPSTRASIQRFSALIAIARGEAADIEPNLKAAIGLYREVGLPFHTASAELELAEWLVASNRAGEAADLLEDARTIFPRSARNHGWNGSPRSRRCSPAEPQRIPM